VLRSILTFIQYGTSGRTILGLASVAALLMFLMNGTALPFSAPTIEQHSGGLAILDMQWSYTPQDAYELFAALGQDGRQAYRVLHLAPDTVFPISYALLFAFISAWFLVRLLPLEHRLQWLSMLPLVSGSADLLENLLLVTASLAYPSRVDGLVRFAHLLTRLKFGLMPLGLVFLAVIMVMWFIRNRPVSNVPLG